MALSKLVKLAMKGATKTKKLPKKSLNIPEGIKEKLDAELPLEKNTPQREFLEERTISGISMEDVRKGGLPDSPANLPGYEGQTSLIRKKRDYELSDINKYVDEGSGGISPFFDMTSIKSAIRAGADIKPADIRIYMELQKKYRPNYNLNPQRIEGSQKIVDFEVRDGLTKLERKQLSSINKKMYDADEPIRERANLLRIANMTDQEIFIDAKGMQNLSDEFGMDDFNIEEYIKESLDLRNNAIKQLEETGYVKPTTDFIERTEPSIMEVPIPANERKKGGSVIERNPYGDYQRLI